MVVKTLDYYTRIKVQVLLAIFHFSLVFVHFATTQEWSFKYVGRTSICGTVAREKGFHSSDPSLVSPVSEWRPDKWLNTDFSTPHKAYTVQYTVQWRVNTSLGNVKRRPISWCDKLPPKTPDPKSHFLFQDKTHLKIDKVNRPRTNVSFSHAEYWPNSYSSCETSKIPNKINSIPANKHTAISNRILYTCLTLSCVRILTFDTVCTADLTKLQNRHTFGPRYHRFERFSHIRNPQNRICKFLASILRKI